MNRRLGDISKHFGSNKIRHDYESVYEKYFEHLRDKKDLKIVEIGIWEGNSLRMWKEYFPHGEVYGFDIHKSRLFSEDRIHTSITDQNDREALKKEMDKIGEVDIIIDDGSHFMEHMQTSFGCLYPYVKEGGYYCIEDVHTSYFYCNLDKDKLMKMYGISKDFYNTTFVMLRNYEVFGKIYSQYMTEQEMAYINSNISDFDLDIRNNYGSVCAMFTKTGELK